jgi:Ca-activated chloride channel family protein
MHARLLLLCLIAGCATPLEAAPAKRTPAACTVDPSTATKVTSSTGALRGAVCDTKTGERLVGVTVTATSPALRGAQTAITGEDGQFVISNLPPGAYTLTFYYLDATTAQQTKVAVAQTTSVVQQLDPSTTTGEVITIRGSAPVIDHGSTKQGITISQNYVRVIPVPGRTFSGALGAAAGTQHDEGPSTEAYARIDDNTFQRIENHPLSTFSIDVDTAAYSNTRRFLRSGTRPPQDAVRIEELLNYFRYAYPAPTGNAPFSITTEVGPSPWNPKFKLARIGIQTRPIADASVPPRNLVFLIDVSGSMDDPQKLPLLVKAMGLLVDNMRPEDRIAIAVYAGASGLVLPSTTGKHKSEIRAALASLEPGGSTNGAAGIRLAYQSARKSFLRGGINRVILCTDGDFNVGVTSEGELTRLIERERQDGVFLTVLGFGMGNLKDSTMEKLADRGNGNYGYIDSIEEARKLLVKEAGATLVTVAKDVKLQIELNPAKVAGYRLIGYENRKLASEDFNDDRKDAGELGAGHSVTALYEIVPLGVAVPAIRVDKLKYQKPAIATTGSSELMTVKVRYKAPDGTTSKLLSQAVADRDISIVQTSTDFRWAAAVAGFGMLLRESPERGAVSWPMVSSLANGAIGADVEGYRREFIGLANAAAKLKR